MLHDQVLDRIVCETLGISPKPADLGMWDKLIYALENPKKKSRSAWLVKYVDLTESYKSLTEALRHAGIHTESRVNIEYVDSEEIEANGTASLEKYDAILVPVVSVSAVSKVRFWRRVMPVKTRSLYLGICLGMQVALIEYARNKAGLSKANSTEFDLETEQPVVALINEWQSHDGKVEQRDENSDLGGTMRLGATNLRDSNQYFAAEHYGNVVTERHRHRYEANNHYLKRVEDAGLVVSARTPTEDLCEIIELPKDVHPFYLGVQYHPEFKSTPRDGHPLFTAYAKAAIAHKQAKRAKA